MPNLFDDAYGHLTHNAWEQFQAGHEDIVRHKVGKMEALLNATDTPNLEVLFPNEQQRNAVTELCDKHIQSRFKLNELGTLTPTGWVIKDGVEATAFETAHTAHQDAAGKLESFLKGETSIPTAAGEVSAPDALKNVYQEAREAVDAQHTAFTAFTPAPEPTPKVSGGLFGHVKAKGAQGILENMGWKKGSATGRMGNVVFRNAVVAAGIGMDIDAFTRRKNKDGDDRSWGSRLTEATVGTAAIASGLLVGNAR